jgi:hypothetical protein
MANRYVAADIQTYMSVQQHQLAPPNGWWWLKKLITNGVLCYLWMACVGVVLLAPRFRFEHWPQVASVAEVIVVSVIILYIISSFGEHPPGVWQRYSVKNFYNRYGKNMFTGSIAASIANVRKIEPMAEFELAVLETKGRQRHGVILFQVYAGEHVLNYKERPLLVDRTDNRHCSSYNEE